MQIFPGQSVIFFNKARILYKDILNLLNKQTIMKKQKMRITLADFILANRRASRAEEIEKYGQQVHNRRMVHKSKKKYDRKAMKRAVIKGDDSSYYSLPYLISSGSLRRVGRSDLQTLYPLGIR